MTARDDRIGVEVRITGRVQGVCFRAWTQAEAERHGISGWVRNETDGSVKALFVGPRHTVNAMLGRCRDGPPAARVSGVVTEEVAPAPAMSGFRISG